MAKIKLMGGALAFFALNAFAQSANPDDWTHLVSRCSHASKLVTGAFESYPNNKSAREGLIEQVLAEIKVSKKLGAKQTPTEVEILITQASGETLMGAGVNPKASPNARDWFIAQTAATCALKTSELKSQSQ